MRSQDASAEAERCLQCNEAPCIDACPTHIEIPTFIAMVKSGNFRGAAEIVKTANALANVCGAVCPEEIYCQSVCTRARKDEPIKIRELHKFATQTEAERGYSRLKKFAIGRKKVAVIGGGPAGLGCAFELVKLGYNVTVFEKNLLGGVPRKTIPSFRLADNELRSDIDFLVPLFSVKKENVDIDRLSELKREYDAVFLAVGLGRDRNLGIKGEKLPGVYAVLQFLERAKTNPARLTIGRKVIVVGGGNVSLDAAATAKRLGASDVVLIYRRSEKEMRVWKSELEEARMRGVEIRFLTNPVKIIGNGKVNGVVCSRMRLLRKRDTSGRPIPAEIPNSAHTLQADTVVIAVGQEIETALSSALKRTPRGFIAVNKHYQTSERRVFAGGDAVNGEGTIVLSVAQGKEAAHSIHRYLTSQS